MKKCGFYNINFIYRPATFLTILRAIPIKVTNHAFKAAYMIYPENHVKRNQYCSLGKYESAGSVHIQRKDKAPVLRIVAQGEPSLQVQFGLRKRLGKYAFLAVKPFEALTDKIFRLMV